MLRGSTIVKSAQIGQIRENLAIESAINDLQCEVDVLNECVLNLESRMGPLLSASCVNQSGVPEKQEKSSIVVERIKSNSDKIRWIKNLINDLNSRI